jgi:hypothetical protein
MPAVLKKYYCCVSSRLPEPCQVGQTYRRVSKDNGGTGGPLATNADAACQCPAPIETLKNLQVGRILGFLAESSFGLNTVLDNTVLVFLKLVH